MAILQNCTKAEVYDTKGTLLCPATVQSGPMDSILVITPDSFDHKDHDLFCIVFYDPVLGVLTCRCELSAPLDLPDHMTSYRCEILERLNQEQRRQDVKVSVAAGADVTIHVARQPGDHIPVVKPWVFCHHMYALPLTAAAAILLKHIAPQQGLVAGGQIHKAAAVAKDLLGRVGREIVHPENLGGEGGTGRSGPAPVFWPRRPCPRRWGGPGRPCGPGSGGCARSPAGSGHG